MIPVPQVPSVETLRVPVGVVADEVRVDEVTGLTEEDEGVVPVPQVPKPVWHPVPQYSDVEPHQPAGEQQLPNVEPRQVDPPLVPQVASVLTFLVAVDDGAVEVRVEVDEVTGREVEELAGWDEEDELPQVPKPVWQPVPQYSVVLPHQPAELQQLPNVEPRQVAPPFVPQVASVLTFFEAVDEGAVEVVVEERMVLELDGDVLPDELRYQLVLGSPRHSPTVTAL